MYAYKNAYIKIYMEINVNVNIDIFYHTSIIERHWWETQTINIC